MGYYAEDVSPHLLCLTLAILSGSLQLMHVLVRGCVRYWNYRKAEALKKLKALQKAGNGASAAQVAAEAGQSVPITA